MHRFHNFENDIEETAQTVQSELQRVFELLHNNGLVFLVISAQRSPNVMITKANKVKLTGMERKDKPGILIWYQRKLIVLKHYQQQIQHTTLSTGLPLKLH